MSNNSNTDKVKLGLNELWTTNKAILWGRIKHDLDGHALLQLQQQQKQLIDSFWVQFYHMFCDQDYYAKKINEDNFNVDDLFNPYVLLGSSDMDLWNQSQFEYIERRGEEQKFVKFVKKCNNNRPLLLIVGCRGSGKSFAAQRILTKHYLKAFDIKNDNDESDGKTDKPIPLRFAVSYKTNNVVDIGFCWLILALFALKERVKKQNINVTADQAFESIIKNVQQFFEDWD